MIKIVFINSEYTLELMMQAQNLFTISPEELLIRLEEMLSTNEITQDQLKELMS